MAGTDKRKQLLYLPEEMLLEIMREANRLDRSMSWTVQRAWSIAREDVHKFPAAQPAADAVGECRPARELQRPDSTARSQRMTPELERARAEADLREFLRGKFDRNVNST